MYIMTYEKSVTRGIRLRVITRIWWWVLTMGSAHAATDNFTGRPRRRRRSADVWRKRATPGALPQGVLWPSRSSRPAGTARTTRGPQPASSPPGAWPRIRSRIRPYPAGSGPGPGTVLTHVSHSLRTCCGQRCT